MTQNDYLARRAQGIKAKAHSLFIVGKHYGSKPTARLAKAIVRQEKVIRELNAKQD